MNDPIIVFSTCASEAEARRIAEALVERRQAACVQRLTGLQSMYMWQGNCHDDAEVLLIIKSRQMLFPAVEATVREFHSYDVPQIAAVPMTSVSKDYLAWMQESLI